jgi:uncharacterized protein YbgA (DUF1722 family)/uncharacterized protein YbbK (DUF523 family)
VSGAPRLGISRCLLGDEVRYDGGHKRDAFLVSMFGRFVEWVPVCPEVELGMGTPREAIQLVAAGDGAVANGVRVRLVGVHTRTDWTDAMTAFSRSRLAALESMHLSGYVLKKDSPSCGLERVRIRNGDAVSRTGRGLFADALATRWPSLPMEDEGRLHDPVLRENFVERIFAYQRLRAFFDSRWTVGGLVRFHTIHKLQLLAHSRQGYTGLGQLVATASGQPRRVLASAYERLFMTTLRRAATPKRQADVLTHIAGHLKRVIDAADRDELVAAIDDHRLGLTPLIVPITLIRHHVRRHDVAYLRDQVYLDPHPRELGLRNHV